MVDFNALLDQRVEDVKPPPLMPVGTFTWQILSRKFGKSAQKKTDYVEFEFKCVGHDDDIDGELPEGWDGRIKTETWYITPDALSRLTDWMVIVDPSTAAMSAREAIEHVASGDKFVKGHLSHRPYTARDGGDRIAVDFDLWASA